MQFSNKREWIRWFIIFSSFVIVTLIVWNTYTFFQFFKDEERTKMELWATAQKTIANADEHTDIELPFQISSTNTSIPLILTNEKDSILDFKNISEEITNNKKELNRFFSKIQSENEPIKMELTDDNFQLIYYGNSPLINKLKYYPIALLLIVLLFLALIYNYFRTSKMSIQNKLWAGMAKETAHQIGTPLSSLLGWLEFLKAENSNSEAVIEIEKDITRLQTITDRFSKIGSEPVLEKCNIVVETKKTYDYLKSRSSKQINFSFEAPENPIICEINPALHSWTIENLVKNAIDAMKGKGNLKIVISELENRVKIQISDSGKGIAKNQFSKVFNPVLLPKNVVGDWDFH